MTPAKPKRPVAVAEGPVLILATVAEARVDEHELARAMHGAAVEGIRRAGLAGKRVRLTVHAEVVG